VLVVGEHQITAAARAASEHNRDEIKTVEVHLSRAYRKLELSSRAQLESVL